MTIKRGRRQPAASAPAAIEEAATAAPNLWNKSDEELAAETIGWWDEVLNANEWFALNAVDPVQAALLVCCFNPHEGESIDAVVADAMTQTTDHTGPQDFKVLRTRFMDVASTEPNKRRTLRQWLALAKDARLRVHPWADEYLAAVEQFSEAPQRAPSESAPEGTQESARKWTAERLAELEAYRKKHGTKAASSHFGISEARVRKLLPGPSRTATMPTANWFSKRNS